MPTARKWKLIQRYVTNRSSAADRAEIEQWMDRDPANRKLVEEVEQLWSGATEEHFEVSVQDAWDRFRVRKMRGKLPNRQEGMKIPSANRRMLTIFRAAAAIVLAAFVGFFSWQYLSEQRIEEKQQAYRGQVQDIKTQKGEKAQVSFSDGTVVTLNAASALRYPKQFKGAKREVYLEGEGYFDVVSNADKPFVVHTTAADVEVLGTKFNVRAWKEDTQVNIGVREGKVAVRSADSISQKHRVLLTGGQYVSVVKGGGISDIQEVDIAKHLLWLKGGIYFDNVPFSKVVRQIERRFDVQIAVRNKDILEVPFTSTFRDKELNKVLQVLAASMKMKYRQKGNKIEFYEP